MLIQPLISDFPKKVICNTVMVLGFPSARMSEMEVPDCPFWVACQLPHPGRPGRCRLHGGIINCTSPQVDAYFEALLSLEAMREWQANAILEPWREPGHEAEVCAAGTVLSDYRQSDPGSPSLIRRP